MLKYINVEYRIWICRKWYYRSVLIIELVLVKIVEDVLRVLIYHRDHGPGQNQAAPTPPPHLLIALLKDPVGFLVPREKGPPLGWTAGAGLGLEIVGYSYYECCYEFVYCCNLAHCGC